VSVALQRDKLKEFIQIRIALARKSFWQYCMAADPIFYLPERKHLKILCNTLQALFESKIVRKPGEEWRMILPDEPLSDLEVCRNLIINMPPRHGKTRTLVLFEAWILGRNKLAKFVTASYNDDAAADISRYVRDTLAEVKQGPTHIVYADIFDTTIKKSDASIQRWAVDGSYFSYIGTGPGGTVTGKGADWLIVDDPVKNAETAFNALAMKKINSWVMNTLLSRTESGARKIIVHTRWPNGDITHAFMSSPEAHTFYHLVMEAYDGTDMLCDEIMSKADYDSKRNLMDMTIFEANYNQHIIRPEGALYRDLKTYTILPESPEREICFIDTADKGEDFLCAVFGVVAGSYAYVTDVVYTQEPVEASQPLVVEALISNGTKELCVESNSGGAGFAKDVEEMLIKRGYNLSVETPMQLSNKETRLITNSAAVQQRILFPLDWNDRFPQYYEAMTQHLRIGRNLHDDAPDATTGFYEFAFDGGVILA